MVVYEEPEAETTAVRAEVVTALLLSVELALPVDAAPAPEPVAEADPLADEAPLPKVPVALERMETAEAAREAEAVELY